MNKDDRRVAAIKRLIGHLSQLLNANLKVRLWTGEYLPLGAQARDDLSIVIRSPDAISRLVRRPRLVTAIELFAAGEIDLEGGTLFDLAARRGEINTRSLLRRLDKRLLFSTFLPFWLRGSKARSSLAYRGPVIGDDAKGRNNQALIQFHYDLSNDFYALFLDSEMQYSCAYFDTWDTSLEAAQSAKLDMICRKLRLVPGERFLDIGCGWGGLLCHAADRYRVKAHGVTLSQAQYEFAQAKISALGLTDRVTIELKDYRELDGVYDKVASIGMFEHVGIGNQATYFKKMHALLKPRGLLLNHAITRPAKQNFKHFRKKRAEYAAIVDYIFPGSELDYIGNSVRSMECHGFEVHDVEAWREHYARTTKLWHDRLAANRSAAGAKIGDAKTRLWLLYLAGVSLGFARGSIGVFQTLASRRQKGPSGLPPTRQDLYERSLVTPASRPNAIDPMLSILPIADQIVDDARISQRRRVAECCELVFGNFA
jgi:cyclopropane-fatty-acyl-phospholipid synthase